MTAQDCGTGAKSIRSLRARVWIVAVVVVTASLLCSCTADPVTLPVSSRDLGSPAPDQLDDLNKWVGNSAVIDGDVSFKTGEAALTEEGTTILLGLTDHLQTSTGTIKVDGFADGVGGDSPENDELSKARAATVQAWLIDEGHVSAERFAAPEGHGTRDEVGGVAARDGVADPLRRVVRITVG
ncbi:outer membrane protein OmpA-like peptidoglycan-associated protein [Microbacterium sp. SORGH_AS 1204]|uniref:OmpA family protein n=1 Tax=Microbacterium sp. SORGH_AS_1204 TaxID=3041785 RepID=UPI0027909666|nr:OmpA family protein [Microbacterium sp. SORGH_AS_1204]MDQ1138452.1 outer membrane protein OmpA-like peptidoglycan-associated protein [Microbacterium sp. SORGH_AS_1204]